MEAEGNTTFSKEEHAAADPESRRPRENADRGDHARYGRCRSRLEYREIVAAGEGLESAAGMGQAIGVGRARYATSARTTTTRPAHDLLGREVGRSISVRARTYCAAPRCSPPASAS